MIARGLDQAAATVGSSGCEEMGGRHRKTWGVSRFDSDFDYCDRRGEERVYVYRVNLFGEYTVQRLGHAQFTGSLSRHCSRRCPRSHFPVAPLAFEAIACELHARCALLWPPACCA